MDSQSEIRKVHIDIRVTFVKIDTIIQENGKKKSENDTAKKMIGYYKNAAGTIRLEKNNEDLY